MPAPSAKTLMLAVGCFAVLLPSISTAGYNKRTVLEAAESNAEEQAEISSLFARLSEHVKHQEKAAQLLESMEDVATYCDLDGYQTLMKFYQSATHELGLDETLEPNNGVNEILIEALKMHGQACRPQYSIRFPEFESEMEPHERVLAGKVARFLSNDVLDLLFPEDDFKVRVRAIDIVPDRFVANVPRALFMERLNAAARRTADRINVASDLSERDFSRHLLEPCKTFVSTFDNIFLPARLDLALDEDKIYQINPRRELKFNEAWIRFRVCSALVRDPTKSLELINKQLRKE